MLQPDTKNLTAYSPTGALIKSVLELSLATREVTSFSREDGNYEPVLEDDVDEATPESTYFDGKLIYVDENDVLWPEAALVYKKKSTVERESINPTPLPSVDPSFAIEMHLKARQLEALSDKPLNARDLDVISGEQGWDDVSMLVHLRGFIESMGLMGAMAAYAKAAAAEENAFSAAG